MFWLCGTTLQHSLPSMPSCMSHLQGSWLFEPRPLLLCLTDLWLEQAQKKPMQSFNRTFNNRVSGLSRRPRGPSLSMHALNKSYFQLRCRDAALIDVALWLLIRVKVKMWYSQASRPKGQRHSLHGLVIRVGGQIISFTHAWVFGFSSFIPTTAIKPSNVGTVYSFYC